MASFPPNRDWLVRFAEKPPQLLTWGDEKFVVTVQRVEERDASDD